MVYNIEFGIAGLLFLIIYYFFLRAQYATESIGSRKFRALIVGVFLADLLDVVTAVTISYSNVVPLWLNYILNSLCYETSTICAFMLTEYIRYRIDPERGKRCLGDRVNIVLLVIYSLLCMSTPFTKLYIYFDADGVYRHGKLFMIMFVMPLYFMVYTVIRMIMKRDKFTLKHFLAIFVCTTISGIGAVIQMVFLPTYLLTFFSISLGAFIALFALETPDYVMLTKTMEELSESKELLEKAKEKDNERTRTIHELMRTASWVLYFGENDMVIDGDWSDEFLWMLGYSKEEIDVDVYEIWGMSLHPEDKSRAMNAFTSGMMGESPFDEIYRLRNKAGEYRWYRGTGELKRNAEGKVTSYQGIIQDIHDEKMREILTEEKVAALEELKKSEEALKDALLEAKEANAAKSRFLSNMSHDIRTPMNAIVGFTDLAIENSDDMEMVKDYLKKIQTSGNHLLSLINDILDMSRIESGKVVIEESKGNLADIIFDIESIVGGEAKNHGLTYTSDVIGITHRGVYCDKLRLRQILLNCIGNSIKFTPEGGSVSVKVSEIASGRYVFRISDTGIGMSEEFLQHIFEPFERERTSTISKTQGTGLGMSITKNLVEMMGGTIDIESKINEGTTYVITLPFRVCENEETSVEDTKVPTSEVSAEDKLEFLKGKHFLLVDDNSTNRIVARGLLKSRNMTIEETENGQLAVERLERSKEGEFDAVLMDVQMPIMNGYEASDKIRELSDVAIAGIPIVAMTADAFEEDKARCFEHGMNGHIAKPFKIDELVDVLYGVLNGQ